MPYESYRDEPKRAGSPGSNERDGLVYNDYGVAHGYQVCDAFVGCFLFFFVVSFLLICHPVARGCGMTESYRDEPKRAGSPGSNERDGLVYNDYGVAHGRSTSLRCGWSIRRESRASRGVRSSMSRFAFSLRKGSLVSDHLAATNAMA
jgi:hypothetical protein